MSLAVEAMSSLEGHRTLDSRLGLGQGNWPETQRPPVVSPTSKIDGIWRDEQTEALETASAPGAPRPSAVP
jgi:hypothetical protein